MYLFPGPNGLVSNSPSCATWSFVQPSAGRIFDDTPIEFLHLLGLARICLTRIDPTIVDTSSIRFLPFFDLSVSGYKPPTSGPSTHCQNSSTVPMSKNVFLICASSGLNSSSTNLSLKWDPKRSCSESKPVEVFAPTNTIKSIVISSSGNFRNVYKRFIAFLARSSAVFGDSRMAFKTGFHFVKTLAFMVLAAQLARSYGSIFQSIFLFAGNMGCTGLHPPSERATIALVHPARTAYPSGVVKKGKPPLLCGTPPLS